MPGNRAHTGRTLWIAAGSLLAALLVLGLKYLAFSLTGSVALYSDALESIVNVVTALTALVAVVLSGRPANATLPYGYGKAEYFSAVFVGVMILVAAGLIFREAYLAYGRTTLPEASLPGLAANGAATAINAVWALVLLRHGRVARSPALLADGKHLLTDVVSSIGVLVGVALAFLTGWVWLDAALAALVALNILWSGWGVMRDSVGGLMDVATTPEELRTIRETISANAAGALEAHDIRTRQAGSRTFVDFHLVVPGAMTVAEAHAICDRIEAALRIALAEAMITIHVEPEDKAKHSGIVVL